MFQYNIVRIQRMQEGYRMPDIELSDRDFERFRTLVYKEASISLGDRKRALVRTRFAKVMRQHGIETYSDYYDFVLEDKTGKAMIEMINAISTNLTHFFREGKHFDYMREILVPEMIAAARNTRSSCLRGWSAGCSTGEEPYTLAIVLMENIPDPLGWDIKILATDIDSSVLERASAGHYEKKQLREMPPMLINKYFERTGDRKNPVYEVKPNLKRLIAFRRLNLMRNPYPFKGPFDFIFCRNVMIYFDRPTQETLVNRYYQLLRPGGHLFVGHSESLTGLRHPFRYVQPTIYRK
jgi:chemotaxis protein methyltransferase CheR